MIENILFDRKLSTKLAKELLKVLKNKSDARHKELNEISDTFGDVATLAKYYIKPKCQNVNPADEHEDQAISVVRDDAINSISTFMQGDILTKDGANQMFILADAGMGKTSILMMLKLYHLSSIIPSNVTFKLYKLDAQTIEKINALKNKSETVLLLDSLDEDPSCKEGNTEKRLLDLLNVTSLFRRVIITCRTQFFPSANESTFKHLGKITFKSYTCPLIYLSFFSEKQVEDYLNHRYPKKFKHVRTRFQDPKKQIALQSVTKIGSLQFRPFLLAHIEDIIEKDISGANEYEIYDHLIDRWLNREVIRQRKQYKKEIEKSDLLKACIWLAEKMHMSQTNTVSPEEIDKLCRRDSCILMFNDPVEKVIDGITAVDIGTNSLLNRNSSGEFRFSHLSVREFLIVKGIELEYFKRHEVTFYVTDKITDFLKNTEIDPSFYFINNAGGYWLNGFTLKEPNQLYGKNLENASLEKAVLTGANLAKQNLAGINFSRANLTGALMSFSNLSHANLTNANLTTANLTGADLSYACLEATHLENANLMGANLSNTIMNPAVVKGANFKDTDID